MKISICFVLLFAVPAIWAWDNNEMEIFDLVRPLFKLSIVQLQFSFRKLNGNLTSHPVYANWIIKQF